MNFIEYLKQILQIEVDTLMMIYQLPVIAFQWWWSLSVLWRIIVGVIAIWLLIIIVSLYRNWMIEINKDDCKRE